MFGFLQTIKCEENRRNSKSLLACVDGQDYFTYSVTHHSQLWSLASRAGSVRQELSYECDGAYAPLSFTGWDETEFDKLDKQQRLPCNVNYAYIFMLIATNHFLFQNKNDKGINEYSLTSRVPTRLPIIDVKAKKPSGSVSITIKEVCFC